MNDYYGLVAGRIQEELKQNKPCANTREEAVLNIIRTADLLTQRIADLLKTQQLSPAQYNILRILRGSPDGLCCREVGDRLIARDPDVTRIMDRLEKRNLITRHRAKIDRRFVTAKLTREGLELVNLLDEPIQKLHATSISHMSDGKLSVLIELLENARFPKEN